MTASTFNTIQSTQTVRVMIVEDHPLFRGGIESILELEDHIQITGFCDDGDKVLAEVIRQRPDVILMDVNLPGPNGLELTRRLQSNHHHIAVVILTAHHDEEQTLHAIRSGASAYYPKHIDGDTLVQIIEDVRRGFYVINGKRMRGEQVNTWMQAKLALRGDTLKERESHLMPLSPRELEILRCVTNGMLNKQVAMSLGISQQTVKNHMTSILRKLNVEDRTQAVIVAIRRGWVRIDESISKV